MDVMNSCFFTRNHPFQYSKTAVFPQRKIYTEQMFDLLREVHATVQPCRHTNSEASPALIGLCDIHIYISH